MRSARRPFVGVAPVVVIALGSCVGVTVGQTSNCGAAKGQTATGFAPAAAAVSTAQISPEQQAQLTALFQQLLSGVEGLRSDAQTQIRALLTPEQQVRFDTPSVQHGPMAQSAQTNVPAATSATTATPGGTGSSGTMQSGSGDPPSPNDPAQQTSLTDAQHHAIHEIMGSLHATDQALHDQARLAFRAILTPSQAAVLDQLRGQPAGSNAAPAGANQTGAAGSTNDPLQLTADQQSQAAAMLSQLQVDRQALQAAGRQQITALLADQQNAQGQAINSTSQTAPGGTPTMGGTASIGGASGASGEHDRHGHEQGFRDDNGMTLFDALTQLNLTAYQGSSIASILSNLHNAIEAQVQQTMTSSAGITASAQGTTSTTTNTQPAAGQ